MKKLFIILILSLCFSSAQAVVFEECYSLRDPKTGEIISHKQKHKKKIFNSGDYERFYFTLRPKLKAMEEVLIFNDEFFKVLQNIEGRNYEKSNKNFRDIVFFNKDYIETYSPAYRFDLKTGVIFDKNDNKPDLICSLSGNKKSYLDYWWAAILIIAIIFFIFTQSGKRLKQIRRK
jgi:hypothetical protein